MKRDRLRAVALILLLTLPVSSLALPDLTDKTKAAWQAYIDLTEKRVEAELRLATLPRDRSNLVLLKSGKIQTQPLTTPGTKNKSIPDGRIHHWLGAVFIPNKKVDDLIPWLQNYTQYRDFFKDVDDSRATRTGDEFDVFLHLKRTKIKTAHFSTKHKVVYTRKAPGFVYSVNRSYEIREIENAGIASEKLLPVGKDNGYLWGLNSYWRFFERDGGVVVECETVGLSRDLGWGLGLVNLLMLGRLQGIADSIAREALESMLTDLRDGATGGAKKPSAK